MLASLIGCSPAAFPQTYLGLPLTAHKLRVQDIQHLVVKVEKRAPGWKTSLLNLGSCLTLTDVALSALPTFAMSIILMPVTTIDHMDRPRRGVLWKGKSSCSGGGCQVAWHDVFRSRAEGGLGVRGLHCHNISLLQKFIHKLVHGDDTPWTRWVHRWHLFSCLPTQLTHCTPPALTVADALRHARLNLPLQGWLTVTVQRQLAVLEASLRHATLAEERDSRLLPGGAKFTAAAA
ncbi:hypothetical protein QYE76_009139 [Lolium multiflorum]|uniref:Uncharacterized protein n=1 Tax=Lolium multiflorum TaxID=4521 RepID=A0AAD8TUM9_LOLMU|nr:hypothetical protein QYE76_009139 [Lolium multiflorum]